MRRARHRWVPRRIQRALRRWRSGPVRVHHHPTYRLPVPGGPMDPRRADDVLTWAIDRGLVDAGEVVAPMEVSWEDARLVHTDAYLASLDDPAVLAQILGWPDAERVSVDALVETWRRACGATVAAAEWAVRTRGTAINLLGGFHHAAPDRGGGFCALNDVAIAIARLRRDGFTDPIAIIDCDAHPPDGIVACLDDPTVVVWSLSAQSSWTVPDPRRTRVMDRRVPPKTTDRPYLAAMADLPTTLGSPTLAFYLAGSDPLVGDAFGGLAISAEGLRRRDALVFAALAGAAIVVLPAGGYQASSWRVFAGTLAEAQGSSYVVEEGYDPLLRRTRNIMRTIDPTSDGDKGALITEQELLGGLGSAPAHREPRFLGAYTRHGLELALTAYGYLPTLRRLGFHDLAVEIEPGVNGSADRMKITAEVGAKREALMDLSASLRVLEGFQTLFIEWLELRDPRGAGPLRARRLPGQRSPGLGVADETLQLLVRAAERLGLDGVSMVPSHYHVAWMARRAFVALAPEARGRVRALLKVMAPVPVADATARLAGPGLPTEDGAVVRWVPVEMVLPVSDGLRAHIAAGEAAAAKSEAAFLDRLARP